MPATIQTAVGHVFTLGRFPVTAAAIVLFVGGQFVVAALCLTWAALLVAKQAGAF